MRLNKASRRRQCPPRFRRRNFHSSSLSRCRCWNSSLIRNLMSNFAECNLNLPLMTTRCCCLTCKLRTKTSPTGSVVAGWNFLLRLQKVKENEILIKFAKFSQRRSFSFETSLEIINLQTLAAARGCHGIFPSKLLLVFHSSILKKSKIE